MLNIANHLSDQDILLFADGELSSSRAAQAKSHLAACWTCRTRMREVESAIGDFVLAYQDDQNHPQGGSSAGSRALLKARLEELASKKSSLLSPIQSAQVERILGCIAAVLLMVATWAYGTHLRTFRSTSSRLASVENSPVPNRRLTPGAIRLVSASEICKVSLGEIEHEVPASLQRKVFQEYGIADPRPQDYELDYLITPELEGADDLRNLWPEPHSATVWNSYVKDALENRLYDMVCSGSLDLATAQRDIATDWISAYKKYFKTDKPIHDHFS